MIDPAPSCAPVVFLDFDGILHSFREKAVDEYFRLLPNLNSCMQSACLDVKRPFVAVNRQIDLKIH